MHRLQHQFAHMLEIVLYARLSSSDEAAKKAYRLYVKERLYRFNFVSVNASCYIHLMIAGMLGQGHEGGPGSRTSENV